MTTTVSGHSDDLVEVDGELHDEIAASDTNHLVFSDGTRCEISYSSDTLRPGVWVINVVQEGTLFDRLDRCEKDDGKNYSDKLYLKTGLEWCDYVCHRIHPQRQ